MGDSSYSAYLLHLPILSSIMLSPLGALNPYALLIVLIATTVAASHLSLMLLEKPSRRWLAGSGHRPAFEAGGRQPD